MNESTISIIAEAVLANTRVLEKLIDSLPVEVKQAVEAKVTTPKAHPAPATTQPVFAEPAPTPVAPVAVAPAPVTVPVAPIQVSAPAMPAPPTFVAPAPAAPAPQAAPFSDSKGLISYVMDAYQKMGPDKGAGIQGVLTSIGVANINDVPADKYHALWVGVEALKG